MATPPPPPPGHYPAPASSTGGGGKILLGCGLGCALLLVLAAAGVGLVVFKVQKAAAEFEARMERMQEAERLAQEARERLRALDEAHPSRLPAEPARTELGDADVDRWLAVQVALAEPLGALAELEARMRAFEERFERLESLEGKDPSFSELGEVFSAMAGMQEVIELGFEREEAEALLVDEAASALDGLETGPTELRRLCALIDWAFLRREGFDRLLLSADEASELEGARSTVELWEGETFEGDDWTVEERRRVQRNLERSRATVERLEEKLSRGAVLSSQSLNTLEARRAEIEAVPEGNARALMGLLDETGRSSWWEPDGERDEGDDTSAPEETPTPGAP